MGELEDELTALIRDQRTERRLGHLQYPERFVTMSLNKVGAFGDEFIDDVSTDGQLVFAGGTTSRVDGCPIHGRRERPVNTLWQECRACNREKKRLTEQTRVGPRRGSGCQKHGHEFWTFKKAGGWCRTCRREHERRARERRKAEREAAAGA